jgi:hypothetical protein
MSTSPKQEKLLEADILERMVKAMNDIKKPPVPPRRRQPRVTRFESRRQRFVQQGTRNTVRAIYQTPEQAGSRTIVTNPQNTTRNVGPTDLCPKNGYCEGKETQSR